MTTIIVKRDGTKEEFSKMKIRSAISKAMLDVGKIKYETSAKIVDRIAEETKDQEVIDIEEIQDKVEKLLMEFGEHEVAKAYILYRNKRAEVREKGWEMSDLQYDIWDKKYRFNGESFEEFLERVSNGNAAIKKRIRKKEFMFAGRILANRGLHKHGLKVTYSNCYVLQPPQDNLEHIYETAGKMGRTYSYGGGVGISLRDLRPIGARVHNSSKYTTGAVSFMPTFSLVTQTIGQKGRRGALMISIPSNHPDIVDFIDIKTQSGSVEYANISLEIDNKFMMAVVEKKPYLTSFTVQDTGEVIEKEVDAFELFTRIAENNRDWAEPGVLFWDRISNWHLMSADETFEFAGTNPCGEEPLPAGGSCLLASINLSEFVVAPYTERAQFDFERFNETVTDAVVALNEVLDEGLPLHPLEEQRKAVEELRQIGLGVMGIAEMCIKLGMAYGSTKSLALCEVIAHMMANRAMQTSALIAKELGTFSRYDWENISRSSYFNEVASEETYRLVQKYGLRNSQLLCIAPTGSISTMIDVSGGIEPLFALQYNRTTKSLHDEDVKYTVYPKIVKEYMDFNKCTDKDLPDYFVTAHDLDAGYRIEMQAVWQKYIDASISSTINLPKGTTTEHIREVYTSAWEFGLKGVTVYVDECKRAGILTLGNDDKPSEEEEEVEKVDGFFSKCPDCKSDKMVKSNGCVTCQDCGFSPCS